MFLLRDTHWKPRGGKVSPLTPLPIRGQVSDSPTRTENQVDFTPAYGGKTTCYKHSLVYTTINQWMASSFTSTGITCAAHLPGWEQEPAVLDFAKN